MKRIVSLAALALMALPATAAGDDVQKVEKPIRVLLGIFEPTAGGMSTALNIGVGYDFLKSKDKAPLIYSIFIDRSSRRETFDIGEGGTIRRDVSRLGIGLTARLLTSSANDKARSYFGAGIGSYTFKNGASKSKFGGKVFVGHELNNGLFVEADYTLLSKINGTDPGGIGLRAGLRF